MLKEFTCVTFAALCLMCGSSGIAAPAMPADSKVVIENQRMRIAFDRKDNAWILDSIQDRKDGFEIVGQARKASALWEIELVRRDARIQTKFRGGSAGEPVDFVTTAGERIVLDATKSAASVSHQVTDASRQRVNLIWDGIKLPDNSTLKVAVDVDLSATDGLSHWSIGIEGTSPTYALWAIRFVRLEGLARAKAADSEYFLLPAGTGLRYPMVKNGGVEWVYPSSNMELQMSSYLLTDVGKGLLFACFDPQANTKKFHISNQAGEHRLFWEHYPENMGRIAGDYRVPYPVVIGAFDGDWFEAAQVYKSWATRQPWCSRGPIAGNDIPDWFKQIHQWKRPDGDPVEMSRNMRAFGDWFGRPFCVQWYCWNQRTYDSLYPDFFPARPGYAQAVKEMEQRGIRIFPYINGLLCDPKSETWTKEGGERGAAKTIEGKLHPYPVESNFWAYHMCPATDFWQERIRRLARDMNEAAPVSGLYFDCLGGMDSKLCFDPKHGHPLGGGHYWHSGFQSMMKQTRADFRAQKRDVAFTTELMCEPMISHFDGVLWCTITSPVEVPLFQAIYGQYIVSLGRGVRWEDFEQDGCFENREAEAFNWGNQLGWQLGTRDGSGNFELEPQYIQRSEFFKELASARQAAINYVVFGEMMTPLKLQGVPQIALEGSFKVFAGQAVVKPVVHSSAWRSPQGKVALCFVNSSRAPVTTSFAFDPATYGLSRSKALHVTAIYPAGASLGECAFDVDARKASVTVPPRRALILELNQ